MNRREALSAVSFLLGGAIIGGDVFLSGCNSRPEQHGVLNSDDIMLLDEVGDTIIPSTGSSPGGKAARIGEFMNAIVTDCYTPEEQSIFTQGIYRLTEASKSRYGKDFMSLFSNEKHALLIHIDSEAAAYQPPQGNTGTSVHYFTMIKQLTVWGYLSSEVGSTLALRHVPVPGRYEGCIQYETGQKAWAI